MRLDARRMLLREAPAQKPPGRFPGVTHGVSRLFKCLAPEARASPLLQNMRTRHLRQSNRVR